MANKRGSVVLSFILLVMIIGGLSTGYFLVKNEELKLVLLLLVAVIGLIGTPIIIFQLVGKARKIRKRLKQIETLIPVESLETLKDKYLEIYTLYLKLPERDKQNFYGRVTQLREKLEGQLKAEKKLQLLLEHDAGTLEQQQQQYEEMNLLYEKLPLKVQEKYSVALTQRKEELEGGPGLVK